MESFENTSTGKRKRKWASKDKMIETFE